MESRTSMTTANSVIIKAMLLTRKPYRLLRKPGRQHCNDATKARRQAMGCSTITLVNEVLVERAASLMEKCIVDSMASLGL